MKIMLVIQNNGESATVAKFDGEVIRREGGSREEFLQALKPGAVIAAEQPAADVDPTLPEKQASN